MKRLLIAAVAALVGTGVALPSVGQSVDEVLDKHYEAIGGLEAWTSLQSMVASGTLSVGGGMMQGPFRAYQKRPAMSRLEFTIQGMNIVQAYDGITAWQIMPMAGSTEPVEADPMTAATIIEQSDMDGPLIGWREDGHSIEVAGTETIDGTEAIHLTVVVRGTTSQFYLDANTYLPIQIKAEAMGMNTTTKMSDYRNVDGLLFPFLVEIDTEMGAQALIFDEVQINVAVDESIFSMNPNAHRS